MIVIDLNNSVVWVQIQETRWAEGAVQLQLAADYW